MNLQRGVIAVILTLIGGGVIEPASVAVRASSGPEAQDAEAPGP
jgi:hypothetical protein